MTANHIFGQANPVPTATATLVAAVLVLSAMPAQGQQPSADQLKAYAQNAVKIISGDKQRIEAFCELNDLTNQLDQAVEEKDTRKAEELSEKGEELLRKLGPEFVASADGVNSVNLSSQEKFAIALGEYASAAENVAHKPLAQPNNRQRTLRRAFLLLPTVEICTKVNHSNGGLSCG